MLIVGVEDAHFVEDGPHRSQKAGALDLVPISDEYWSTVARSHEHINFMSFECFHLWCFRLTFLQLMRYEIVRITLHYYITDVRQPSKLQASLHRGDGNA